MTTLALRHVAFEDLGLLEPLLEARGHTVRYLDIPATRLWHRPGENDHRQLPDVDSADLVVILGGPIGVYETDAYPFLQAEIGAVARRIAAGGPTLGICLGAQLIAAALGARVYPGGTKEIGWAPITLTEAGRRSPLAPLERGSVPPGRVPEEGPSPVDPVASAGLPVLHWHGDTYDLPAGAESLASSQHYQNQAFWYPVAPPAATGPTVSMPPPHVLALQFHLEATAEGLESWYVGHTAEISATDGIEVVSLRKNGEAYAGALAPWARKVFTDWLDLLNL